MPRVVGRRPRVRKVTRVVRHVDPWSVFKIAIIFNLVLYGVLLTAGVLLWNVAYATGTVDNLERFFESFGWSDVRVRRRRDLPRRAGSPGCSAWSASPAPPCSAPRCST